MTTSTTYGARYEHEWLADNGVLWRAELGVAEYAGGLVDVTWSPARAGCEVAWAVGAAGDPAAPLGPAAPSECRLRLFPSAGSGLPADVAALGALPSGSVRLRVLADLDLDGTPEALVWAGYLPQGAVSDAPGEAWVAVDLRFVDGLGLLGLRDAVDPTDEAWDPTAVRALADWLRLWLGPLASASGGPDKLVTRADWRPWLPADDHVPASADPLAALRAAASAWAVDEGRPYFGAPPVWDPLDQAESARAVASRLLARLLLARDRAGRVGWHVVQRDLLARTAGADVPTFAYDLAGADADAAPATLSVEDDAVDTLAWDLGDGPGRVLRGPTRARVGAVGAVESTYEFRPPLDDLVRNGSFEDGTGDGAGSTIAAWTQEGAAERIDVFGLSPDPPDVDDRYNARLPSAELGVGARSALEQSGAYVVLTDGASLEYSAYVGGWQTAGPNPPRVRLSVGAHGVRVGRAEARETGEGGWLPGREAVVGITGLLKDAAYGSAEAVVGAVVLPVGATVRFQTTRGAVELRLAAPARVGDTALYGDLSDALEGGEVATFLYLGVSGSAGEWLDLGLDTAASAASGARFAYRFAGTDPAGVPVAGYLRHRYEGGLHTSGGGGELLLDDVALAVYEGSASPSAFTHRADVSAAAGPAGGAYGVALPVGSSGGHGLGDGPLLDSHTRLLVSPDAGATVYETQQGPDTGWTVGAYSAGDPSSGLVVDALAAERALLQLAGRSAERAGPERWAGTLVLPRPDDAAVSGPEDALYYPTAVYKLYQPCYLASAASAGATSVALTSPPKPGERVAIDTDGAIETARVGAVAESGGAYTATLVDAAGSPVTLASAHAAGARCLYGMAVWPERATWDLSTGSVAVEGSDLSLYTGGLGSPRTYGSGTPSLEAPPVSAAADTSAYVYQTDAGAVVTFTWAEPGDDDAADFGGRDHFEVRTAGPGEPLGAWAATADLTALTASETGGNGLYRAEVRVVHGDGTTGPPGRASLTVALAFVQDYRLVQAGWVRADAAGFARVSWERHPDETSAGYDLHLSTPGGADPRGGATATVALADLDPPENDRYTWRLSGLAEGAYVSVSSLAGADNDSNEIEFEVAPVGETPAIRVVPTRIDFGPVTVGTTATDTFAVYNDGAVDLNLYLLDLSGPDAARAAIDGVDQDGTAVALPVAIPPAGHVTVTVTWTAA